MTAGGVDLGEINLATMESRCCPGHLAGELMDVDGVTGDSTSALLDKGWPLARQLLVITGSDRTP